MKIWKQELRKNKELYDLPVDANIVHFGPDPGAVEPGNPWTGMAFWFTTEGESVEHRQTWAFDVVPTGLDFPSDCQHFGSVVMVPYAWHLVGRVQSPWEDGK